MLATIITRELIIDGKANWFEGVLLLGAYLILAIGFERLFGAAAGFGVVDWCTVWLVSPAAGPL